MSDQPYTRKEIEDMPTTRLLKLTREKSPRLPPFCFIGKPLEESRTQMTQWCKNPVVILISGKETCSMNYKTSYWYCTIDEQNIITDIWRAFDY
jgi:hypothetical protein